MMASRGYDMTPTMYSPDGRIYQVEYAIETVKRGTLAIGIQAKDGVVIAVEEKLGIFRLQNQHKKFFKWMTILGLLLQVIFQMLVFK